MARIPRKPEEIKRKRSEGEGEIEQVSNEKLPLIFPGLYP